MTSETQYVSNAVRALGDRHATAQDARLAEIERLMCGPLEPEERKALRHEYLEATEPKEIAA